MARKLSLSDLNNGDRSPAWATELREKHRLSKQQDEQALTQARAAADQIAKDEGVVLPERQVLRMADQIKNGQDIDIQLPENPPDDRFADAQSSSSTAPTAPQQGLLGRLATYGGAAIDAVQSSLQQTLAAQNFESNEQANSIVDDLQARGALGGGLLGDSTARIQEERAKQKAQLDALNKASAANDANVQRARDMLAGQGATEKWAAQAVLDASSSPLSALSLVGGPTALLGVEDVRTKEYKQAREAGLDKGSAQIWSISQTAPELISLVPAGKVLGKGQAASKVTGGIAERLMSPALRAAGRLARTAGGEALEEMATGSLQDLAAAAVAGLTENEKLRDYAQKQLPKSVEEFGERRAREGLASLLFSGVAAPHAVSHARSEFNQEAAARTESTVNAAAANAATAAVPKRAQRAAEPAQGELFSVEEGPQTKPETTTENTAPAAPLDARSKGGQYKLPLNSPRQSKQQEAENVQTRGGDTYYTPEGEVGSNRRDTATSEAEKAVAAQEKADAKAATDALRKAQDKRKADRSKELTRLTTEAREMPRAERVSHIADRIMEWDAANPVPTAETVAAAPTANPKATKAVAPVVTAVKPTEVTPAKPVAERAKPGTVDATLEDISNKLALGMQEEHDAKATENSAPFDAEDYKTKIRDVVSDLSQANTQKSVDAINLINQGKLILAPSPESIGRKATADVAQFEPGEGKMYLYTDRLKKGDTLGAVIRTYHEATHAGQFNDRQGRPDIMQQMMGKGPAAKAQATIVKAANSGNAIAKRAVDKAQKAAGGDTTVENLEILPYFVGEVVQARGSTLGQLRGVTNDVLASARQFVRKATGQAFDVSMRDLEKAVSGVGREIVQTDLKPTQGDTASMIYGPKAADFEQAKKDGRVYTSSNGREQFVLSDADSTVDKDAGQRLKDAQVAGGYVPLSELLKHNTLFRNMPDAKDLEVTINPDMKKNAFARFFPGTNRIEVSPEVADGKTLMNLRDSLMHEVQHWVQDQNGEQFKQESIPTDEKRAVEVYNRAKSMNDAAVQDIGMVAGRITQDMTNKTDKAVARSIINSLRTPERKAYDLNRLIKSLNLEITDPEAREAFDNYDFTHKELEKVTDAYNDARANAHKRYVMSHTESEAFFTQRTIDDRQEDLPTNPETEDDLFGTVEGGDIGKMALNRELRQGIDKRGPKEVDEDAPEGWALGMGNPDEVNPVSKRFTPAWFTGLFRADKGLSKVDNEIIEHAIASPAGYRMKAEAEMGKYDYAVEKMAAEQSRSKEDLNRQIQKDIDELPKDLKTHAENVKAFNDMAGKYGKAGEALKAMRDQVDDLTMSILQQRADSGVPLTEAEKKLYKTLVENMGKYTHRQYAAHAGKLGNKYASAVMKDYEKYKAGKGQDNPTIAANYQKVADATKYLIDNNLSIPDDEGLSKLGAEQTRNLYNTWGKVGNPDGLTLDQMKEELADNRDRINGDTDALQSEADTLAKELLGLAPVNSPITTYYRGGKQDTGILKQREAIPPVLRSLMGEITDPSMRLIMTVAKQAEFVGRNRMMLELSKSTGGDILPPGSPRPNGWTRLEGEGYGPLQGHIVSPNMVSAIGDVQQQLATFEQAVAMSTRNPRELGTLVTNKALDLWSMAAGASKMLQVIWSPLNFVYNFVGGPFTMMTNGNINPINFGKGLSSAKDLISYAVNPKAATDAATRLVANDVVDSAFVGEIKNEQYRELRKVVMEMAGRSNPKLETLGEILHKAKAGFKETYAMMDVLYKIANFYHQVDTLTDFYKKNGDEKTPEQIDREAADIVKRTNFTYRRVAPLLKAIESKGFSAFGPYMHEVFRTQIAGVFQGIGEVQRAGTAKTPEARNVMLLQGAKRLTGLAATWGMIGAASSMLSGITFGEDDDENEAKRSLLPEYLRDQDFVEIGKDKDGKPVLFNVARFDPIGPATDLMRGILQGGIDPDQLSKKMLDLYVLPRIGPQLLTALGTTLDPKVKVNRKPLVQELAPEQYSTLLDMGKAAGVPARVSKAWTNVAETLYPGIASSWRSTNARPVSPEGVTTSTYNTATYLGMQLQALDPLKPVKFSAMSYADSVKQGRAEIVDMFQDNPNRTSEQVMAQILSSRSREREAFEDMKKTYDGALATGMTKRQLAAALKEQKLNAQQIKALATDNFASTIVSVKSLEQYEKKELLAAPRADHKEIKRRWKDIKELLKSASREVEQESEDEE